MGGFFLLPWLWVVNVRVPCPPPSPRVAVPAVNPQPVVPSPNLVTRAAGAHGPLPPSSRPQVWYFWPAFRDKSDPHIQRMLKTSLAGAAVFGVALVAWLLSYALSEGAGPGNVLDVRQIPDIGL